MTTTSVLQDLDDLKVQVKKLLDLYKSAVERIDALEEEDDDLGSTFETFEADIHDKLGKVDGRVDELDTDLKNLDGRVDELDTDLKNLEEEFRDLDTNFREMERNA